MYRNFLTLRATIPLGCLLFAAIFIYLGFREENSSAVRSGLWINLGTGFVGTALTVAIVDWLFERREAKNEARRLAWQILHKIDHAVWVWQGGLREFNPNELWALVRLIEDTDPLPSFTQNHMIAIGSNADDLLREQIDIIEINPKLKDSLKELTKLCLIRDGDRVPMPASRISGYLRQAVWDLYIALDLKVPELSAVESIKASVAPDRDSSEDSQRWRHDGETRR